MGRAKAENVRVVCRFRPHNEREKKEEKKAKLPNAPLEIFPKEGGIQIGGLDKPDRLKNFHFDGVIDADTNQEGAFSIIAHEPCLSLLEGYNSTIFVYGQTGSGKTYTMLGADGKDFFSIPQAIGLIPRSVMLIFSKLNDKKASGDIVDFQVEVSFMEIYLEMLRDLQDPFSKKELKVRLGPNGDHWIPNLRKLEAGSSTEVFQYLTQALENRTVSATKMNATSSRSHMIMVLKLTQHVTDAEKRNSTLNFADLAGSEKMKKTEATGKRAEEAKKINLSLTQLGIVISQLAENKPYISYRDSMLTQVLQDSLGGNCKTTLVVNCSKSLFNRMETIGTLEFGKRCKAIKTKAKVNQQYSRKQLQKMLEELRAENAALIRKIENEEYELAKTQKAGNIDESVLAEKIQTITLLRTEMEEKTAETDALRELNDEINKKLTCSRFKMMGFRKQSEKLRATVEETRGAIKKLEQELASSHQEVQKRTEELDSLQTKSVEIQANLTKAENELSVATEKLRVKDEQEAALKQKVDALEAQLSMSETTQHASQSEHSEAVDKLRDLNKMLETQLRDSRDKAEGQIARIHQLEEHIEELMATKSQLEERLTEFTETLHQEQAQHTESRFKWEMEKAELEGRISDLENEVSEMEVAGEERAKQFQMSMREKDLKIMNLERQLQVMQAESSIAVKNKSNMLNVAEDMIEEQVKLTEEEKLLRERQKMQMDKDIEEKMSEMKEMAGALKYLEKFNRTQLVMLEQADRAYAEKIHAEEERAETLRLHKLKEQEAEDARLAKQWQEQYEEKLQQREVRKTNLNMPSQPAHIRASSMDSMSHSEVRGTKRKKRAQDVKMDEKVKLHNGMKGIVKFQGKVHFMKGRTMLGLELTEGKGDTDGTKKGYTYFTVKPGKGKFVTLDEVSHVYRRRAKDGMVEKLRFSAREYVHNSMMEEESPSPSSQLSPHTRNDFTNRELARMTTDDQIQLAIQQSQRQGASPFVGAEDAFQPASINEIQSEIQHHKNKIAQRMQNKKAQVKRSESNRLIREASVALLNEFVEGIPDEEQRNLVIGDFIKDRSVPIVE